MLAAQIIKETDDTVVEWDTSKNIIRKDNLSCNFEENEKFVILLKYLKKLQDPRLVSILDFGLTEDGYFYEMPYLPRTPTKEQGILINLQAEAWHEGLLRQEDYTRLNKLRNKYPDLVRFLEDSKDFYFDVVNHNLRQTDQGQYKWIDLEGLYWNWTSYEVTLAGQRIYET